MTRGSRYLGWFPSSRISYTEYLQAQQFEQSICLSLQKQTQDIVASNEQIARSHFAVVEDARRELQEDTSTLIASVDRGVKELKAAFEWGFSEMLVSFGCVNDRLDQLIKIVKFDAQTKAFEQFEIARDEFRRGLYEEALESVQRAINGFGSNPGYKSEFRFHFLLGTIRLGSYKNCSPPIVDLGAAEVAFLNAARYAASDYPRDAALAYVCASQAAYGQRRLKEAKRYASASLQHNDGLGEGHFQLAKILCMLGEIPKALIHLRHAIKIDKDYALKAASQLEWQARGDVLDNLLGELRNEAKGQYGRLLPLLEESRRRLRGVAAGGYNLRDVCPAELEQVDRYCSTIHAEAATGTFFGFLRATELIPGSENPIKAAVAAFKARAGKSVQRDLDCMRGSTAELEREKARAGEKVGEAPCFWTCGACALLTFLAILFEPSKGDFVDRVIPFIIGPPLGALFFGMPLSLFTYLGVRIYRSNKRSELDRKIGELSHEAADVEKRLRDIRDVAI